MTRWAGWNARHHIAGVGNMVEFIPRLFAATSQVWLLARELAIEAPGVHF
jgi:hypothetical protein